jgi:hypothetical protein
VISSNVNAGPTISSNQSLQQAIIDLQNSGSADDDQSVYINHLSILNSVSTNCVMQPTDKELFGSSKIVSVSSNRQELTLVSGKTLVLQ